jgi:hypothetical protein
LGTLNAPRRTPKALSRPLTKQCHGFYELSDSLKVPKCEILMSWIFMIFLS